MRRIFTKVCLVLALLSTGGILFSQNIVIKVNSPGSIEGNIEEFGVTVGGWAASIPEGDGITADIVLVNDGSGDPTLGCQASPAGAYEGKIAFVRRGLCPFLDKANFAELSGALAVIVVNNQTDPVIINMSAAEGSTVGVPVFMLGRDVGEAILAELGNGEVNMTLQLIRPDDIGFSEVYSPLAFDSYATPQSLINYEESFSFASEIFNVSTQDLSEVEYRVVLARDGQVLETRTTMISLDARTDNLLYTPEFTMPSEKIGEIGTYTLTYELEARGFEDENPSNNLRVIEFLVTDGSYMQSTGQPNSINRICFEDDAGNIDCNLRKDYGHGTIFTFPATEETFTISSVNVVVGGEDGPQNLDNAELIFYWLGVNDFGAMVSGTAELGDGSNEFIGFGEYFSTTEDHNQEIAIKVTDLNEEPLAVVPGRQYAGLLTVPAGVFTGRNNQWLNVPPDLGGFVYFFPNLFYYENVFQRRVFVGSIYMKINFDLGTTVDEVALPEQSVKLFPNPTSDYTMVSLDFENAMNATITLADLNGRVLRTETLQNIHRQEYRLDLGSLSAGTYLVRVATPQGSSTKKLMVVR
jgi:hypothetical protein